MTDANAPRRRAVHGESGSVMILVIFFGVIVAGLITVVADVSTVFLGQRELQAVADGAAAKAAQQADVSVLYGGAGGIAPGESLQLVETEVKTFVVGYAAASAHRPHECGPGTVEITDAALIGDTVNVALTCKVPLPFVKLVDPAEKNGHRISVSAHARLLVRNPP